MQTLDNQNYFTACGCLRIHKNKLVAKILYGFLYAKLIQLGIDDLIGLLFDPASSNKWFFWIGLYAFLIFAFTLWDTFVYHLYLNVQKDQLLFEKLKQIDQERMKHADDYQSHAHSLFVLALSPRQASQISQSDLNVHPASITSIEKRDNNNVVEMLSPQTDAKLTKKAKRHTAFWTFINAVTLRLDFIRLFLFGYVITTGFTKFNEWIFPNQTSSMIVSWLCAWLFITILFATVDCASGKFERDFLHTAKRKSKVRSSLESLEDGTSLSPLSSPLSSDFEIEAADESSVEITVHNNSDSQENEKCKLMYKKEMNKKNKKLKTKKHDTKLRIHV